jgi:hypothetical protein
MTTGSRLSIILVTLDDIVTALFFIFYLLWKKANGAGKFVKTFVSESKEENAQGFGLSLGFLLV